MFKLVRHHIPIIVLLIAAGGVGLFFTYQRYFDRPIATNTSVNQNTNGAADGLFACETDSDCPDSYRCIQTYNDVGQAQKLCNQIVETNANVTPIAEADSVWQDVTYQKLDHGFTLKVPSEWSVFYGSMGNREDYSLVSATDYNSSVGYISLDISYYNNTEDTFQTWVDKHMAGLYNRDELTVSEKKTYGSVTAYDTYYEQVSTSNGSSTYTRMDSTYGFVQGTQGRMYTIRLSGDHSRFTQYAEIIPALYGSFHLIDALPLTTVVAGATVTYDATQAYSLDVTWETTVTQLNMTDPVFASSDFTIVNRDYYHVGTITNGRYADDWLINILETPEGPAFQPTLFRVVYDPTAQTFVYLKEYSDDLENRGFTAVDTASTIPDIYPTDLISIPDSELALAVEPFQPNRPFSYYTDTTLLFTDSSAGKVYFEEGTKCFIVEGPDHMTRVYNLKFDFLKDIKESGYRFGYGTFVPDITWSDSTKNTVEYINTEAGGCGTNHCLAAHTLDELGGSAALQVAGQTVNGDAIYTPVDTHHAEYQAAYDAFNPWDTEKPSYESFIAARPIFFWRDPFGHYIEFKKSEFLPQVECGKPVIYLYPDAPMDVNVRVAPNGGFSITDPVYPDGGWDVRAYPDGRLVTRDGNQYPYLFWEGTGLNYQRPDTGFVVSRAQVAQLLADKLTLLGLNATERADFMEFWVPRMQSAPYYFITFVDQQSFDQLAPLTVTPGADSIIRVFMDYEPLTAPRAVQPLEITTPARNGFTVVEWGGALHE